MTDEGLRTVISFCNLEFLDIDGLHITGSSLSNIPNLTGISCRNCNMIEDEQFRLLFSVSSKLDYIDLKGVENVGNIIKIAVDSVESRTSNLPLVIFVDEVDVDIMDFPENLLLFHYNSD